MSWVEEENVHVGCNGIFSSMNDMCKLIHLFSLVKHDVFDPIIVIKKNVGWLSSTVNKLSLSLVVITLTLNKRHHTWNKGKFSFYQNNQCF